MDNNSGSIEINDSGVLILKVDLMQDKGRFLAKGLLMEAMNVIDKFNFDMAMNKAKTAIIKPSIIDGGI